MLLYFVYYSASSMSSRGLVNRFEDLVTIILVALNWFMIRGSLRARGLVSQFWRVLHDAPFTHDGW